MSSFRKFTISYRGGLIALGPFTWAETLQNIEGLIAAGHKELTISVDGPLVHALRSKDHE